MTFEEAIEKVDKVMDAFRDDAIATYTKLSENITVVSEQIAADCSEPVKTASLSHMMNRITEINEELDKLQS